MSAALVVSIVGIVVIAALGFLGRRRPTADMAEWTVGGRRFGAATMWFLQAGRGVHHLHLPGHGRARLRRWRRGAVLAAVRAAGLRRAVLARSAHLEAGPRPRPHDDGGLPARASTAPARSACSPPCWVWCSCCPTCSCRSPGWAWPSSSPRGTTASGQWSMVIAFVPDRGVRAVGRHPRRGDDVVLQGRAHARGPARAGGPHPGALRRRHRAHVHPASSPSTAGCSRCTAAPTTRPGSSPAWSPRRSACCS